MPFAVAACSFAPFKGRVSENLDRIAERCHQACTEGAELIVFPEAALTGYVLEGGVLELALAGEDLLAELGARLSALPRPLDVLIGFYERAEGDLFNSAAYLELGPSGARLVHVYRKFFLPTYGVFDEERYVTPGRELGVFETRLGRMGIAICEDVWHSIIGTLLAVHGAQLVLVPSASPARGFGGPVPGNVLRYERMLRALSEEHGVYSVNAQLAGFEGGKGFIGTSMVYDPFGKQLVQSPLMKECIVLAEVDFDLITVARAKKPLLGDLLSAWSGIRRIVENGPR